MKRDFFLLKLNIMNEYFDLFSKKPAEGILFIACAMLIMAFIRGVSKGILKSISNKS